MSKTLIIGNWKMNLNIHQASLYAHELTEKMPPHDDVEVVVAPTNLALQTLSLQLKRHGIKLAAQNIYHVDSGTYTGEVSAAMVRGLVQYVLVGHSERRHIFHETDKDIRAKMQAVLRSELTPVLCVGETAHERANNETKHVLHDQICGGLANVSSEDIDKIVVAYEPVWAISDGKDFEKHKTPTPHDLEVAARTIRHQIAALYGDQAGESLRLIYGGSSNPENCKGYLSVDGVDGLLPGGASLKRDEFIAMVEIAQQLKGEST